MKGIYKIIINDKCYIGSSFNIRLRINQHKSDLKCNRHCNAYLQNAYNKYNVFKWEIIEEIIDDISDAELRKLENKWIAKLNSEYNIQDAETNFLIKKVYQFSKDGKFIKEYSSSAQAALELNISQSNIIHAAQENESLTKTAGGFIWRYNKEFGTYIDYRLRKIHMYDLWGRYIATYNSHKECKQNIAPNVRADTFFSNIRNCCMGKISTIYGYRFSYEKYDQLDNSKLLLIKQNYPILQLSYEGDKIIKLWASAKDAASFLNTKSSSITQAAIKNTRCKGYRWMRLGTKSSELLETPEDIKTKAEDANLNVNV